MSKSGGVTAPSNTPGMQQLADNTRLKKHIVLLTEKLAKGAKLPPLGKPRLEENAKTSKNRKDSASSRSFSCYCIGCYLHVSDSR